MESREESCADVTVASLKQDGTPPMDNEELTIMNTAGPTTYKTY